MWRAVGYATFVPQLLAAWSHIDGLSGVLAPGAQGPRADLLQDLDAVRRARQLTRRRGRYFIGERDPCASIEFTRNCPWDCAFCCAWTFYGCTYRKASPAALAEERARIREPKVFIVDDVAFVCLEHGMAIADEIERRGTRNRYYLDTRSDVLLRNREAFARWAKLGLTYLFLGLESLDADQLKQFRSGSQTSPVRHPVSRGRAGTGRNPGDGKRPECPQGRQARTAGAAFRARVRNSETLRVLATTAIDWREGFRSAVAATA
jgi:hypothetical protein